MEHIPSHFKDSKCVYCNRELDRKSWGSEWGEADIHFYKTVRCTACGKKNWLSLNFQGSGHDDFMVKKQVSLEAALDQFAGKRKF